MVRDGEKLRKLLGSGGKKPADLARACNVNPSAVTRYLATTTFTPKVWKAVADGLRQLELDPGEIKTPPPNEDLGPLEDLRPHVRDWDRRQLATLRRILSSGKHSRAQLLFWLDGLFDQHP